MSLWAEVKRETVGPADKAVSSGPDLETRPGDRELGLERMRQAGRQISDFWNDINSSGGSLAWEWILRGSPHGERIQQAEDRVNAIGSRGNPAALKAACDAWVFAWCDSIEAWKRHLPAREAGPDFILKVRQ